MCVVPVNLTYGCSWKTVKTHALLDSCSQGTFMLEKLLRDLGVNGQKTSITIKTVNGEVNNKTTLVEGLKVSSSKDEDGEWIELPKTFTKKYLPVDQDDIAALSKLKQWKYLEGIMDKISKRDDFSVGLLIGANCRKALEPLNIIPSCDNGPYAFQTRLGWCIVGPVNRGNRKGRSCSRISVKMADTNGIGRHHFQVKTDVRETGIKEIFDKMYNKEFAEVSFTGSKKKEISQQDTKFMEILNEGAKLKDGHYQIPLPFKQEDVRLPCNKYQAAQRLSYLKRKFDKNEKFKADYIRFTEEIIVKGYARKSTMTATPGKTWYLPHHGVYHPNKPGKIRVVFDLSAEYKGTCLNEEPLPGPDLTNQIIGVLLRFREEHVGVMGDIEAMFHQVKVPDTQCSFLKFLWWEDSDTSKEIIDYEMTAHFFRRSSSPSCSNYALRKTAMDNEELKDICSIGGFNLTKFISNNTAVLKSIPDDS